VTNFALPDSVFAIDLKSKPLFSAPDGMPVVSPTFPFTPGEDMGFNACAHRAKHLPKTLAMENSRIVLFLFFEELNNIENRVAWFLAELWKAKKGVQKDE
jgi:hypothetical protein